MIETTAGRGDSSQERDEAYHARVIEAVQACMTENGMEDENLGAQLLAYFKADNFGRSPGKILSDCLMLAADMLSEQGEQEDD
jgi:hypothetical protein